MHLNKDESGGHDQGKLHSSPWADVYVYIDSCMYVICICMYVRKYPGV